MFEWFAVVFVAASIPNLVFFVVMVAGLGTLSFATALRSAAPIYIPCSIYLGVLGEIALQPEKPDIWRVLIGVSLFTVVIATMAVGFVLADPTRIPLLGLGRWTALQIVVILLVLAHAAFEKSVIMGQRSEDP